MPSPPSPRPACAALCKDSLTVREDDIPQVPAGLNAPLGMAQSRFRPASEPNRHRLMKSSP